MRDSEPNSNLVYGKNPILVLSSSEHISGEPMPKLVIQATKPLEIGARYQGHLRDPWAILRPEQAYRVIAESTAEEWIDCLVSFGEERAHAEMLSVLDPYFYEIQTD